MERQSMAAWVSWYWANIAQNIAEFKILRTSIAIFQETKLEVPTVYKAYVRECPHKIWPYMIQFTYILGSWNSQFLHMPSIDGDSINQGDISWPTPKNFCFFFQGLWTSNKHWIWAGFTGRWFIKLDLLHHGGCTEGPVDPGTINPPVDCTGLYYVYNAMVIMIE